MEKVLGACGFYEYVNLMLNGNSNLFEAFDNISSGPTLSR